MTVRAPGAPVDAADRPLLLVDVHPTTCGYQALVWALREAERRDASLLAVTITPEVPTEADGRTEMQRALEATVRRAIEETGVRGRTRCQVVTGATSPHALADYAGADLVVIGSQEEVAS